MNVQINNLKNVKLKIIILVKGILYGTRFYKLYKIC